jgi:hypothetical protein
MISTEPSVQADFYFKKEPELDSDGNVVYGLYSKSKDYSKSEEYANNLYIHLPEKEEIDYIYVDIRNMLKSDALHFDFDTPLNFYYDESEAKSIRIDIGTKIELDKDMKLYPKNVILAPNEKKNIIGFYDDENTPKDCDNKVFMQSISIEGVRNSSLLFKRGNFNKADKLSKNLNWRDTNGATYKIGGEYSFINISGYKPIASASSKQIAQVTVKFDNLSKKKATSLNVRDLTVVTDEDRRLELEIDSPAISLTNTTLEVNGQSWVKSRVLRDDHSITVNDTMITLNGTFESKSQSGLYISPKRDKKQKYKASLYFQGDVLVEAKGGSCFIEGKNLISESKIISGNNVTLVDTKIVSASLVESPDSLLIEDVALSSSVVKGLKDSDDKESNFVSRLAVLTRAHLENIDMIDSRIEYGYMIDSDSSFLLNLKGSLAANGLKIEDSSFYISDTCFTTLEVKPASTSEPWIKEKEKNPDIIKNCSFNGGNTINIAGPVDFSNTLFYNTTTGIDRINALESSELSGKNSFTLIEEPISNAILSNVEVCAVSGLSEHYIQNYKADGVKYAAMNEEAKPLDATIKEEPELL